MEAFKDAELAELQSYRGICLSAKEMYRKICELIAEDSTIKVDDFSEHVSKLFAKSWEVPALLMMAELPAKYGKMHEDALVVLAQYEHYKKLTLIEFDKHGEKSFEKEVEDVKISYKSGRLSFWKDNREHLVFKTVSY